MTYINNNDNVRNRNKFAPNTNMEKILPVIHDFRPPNLSQSLQNLHSTNPEILCEALEQLKNSNSATAAELLIDEKSRALLTYQAQCAINEGGINARARYNLFRTYGYKVEWPSIWQRFLLWRKRKIEQAIHDAVTERKRENTKHLLTWRETILSEKNGHTKTSTISLYNKVLLEGEHNLDSTYKPFDYPK